MGRAIFQAALQNRLLTILFVLIVAGLGLRAIASLPIDAVPDVSPNVVQILTNAPGLAPAEVEQLITLPVELAMRGLPDIKEIRSTSRFGLSSVWVYFNESVDIYFARRLVMERLPAAREMIPQGFGSPEMAPVSTGLGEIFQFEVVDPRRSLMELRSILDWQIARRLKEVPGVVEVNSYGGELRTFEVQLRPDALVAYGLSLEDVFHALQSNNFSTGGGYIERDQEQEVIRGAGLISSLEDVRKIVVGSRHGVPIYIGNLSKVAYAPMIRQGAVTRDGKGETVAGVVMMLIGENGRSVVDGVKAKLREIEPTLPEGVKIVPYYDRSELIRRTINTVVHNLAEGALLVTVVLFLFLGDIRASLIVAAVIPLSMFCAFIGMRWMGVSGNLMSLGAIDFGLIVDGSVVMIENIYRRLALGDGHGSVTHRVYEGGREVLRPIVFAIGIIIIVYLPVLSFQEVEGKMFRPMALTVIFALGGSLVCALTFVPVMASLLLGRVAAREPWLTRKCESIHQRLQAVSRRNPKALVAAFCIILALSMCAVPFLGSEFIPDLDEGTILLDVLRTPSISLRSSIDDSTNTEKLLLHMPEVARVITRTGQPEIATDTMGPDESDEYVLLKPHELWRVPDRESLVELMDKELSQAVPETHFGFTQPIEERVQDMLAGIKADVAVHIYGDDMDRMITVGRRMLKVISALPGSVDERMLPRLGLPSLDIEVDREEVARYGINVSEVLDTIETIRGHVVGQVVQGQARYFLQVRFAGGARDSEAEIEDITVAAPGGAKIPLSQLAHFHQHEGPIEIWRDNLNRRVTVAANVRRIDLGSFVASARRAIAEQVELPRGWWLEWGGQYENLARASQRLMILVPVSLLLIAILLYNTFSSMRLALLVFTNVLFAASGGILALVARGLTFSITAGVGFITLFGVSVLNGVVLVSEINRLRESGSSTEDAIATASRDRLRPILMASLVALFGFIPMALAHGSGAEVQKPLATVVIGGLIVSTPFTLYALPLIYKWMTPDGGVTAEGRAVARQ
jgi:cobalt-zinc-cadmium resistance protein CzcA